DLVSPYCPTPMSHLQRLWRRPTRSHLKQRRHRRAAVLRPSLKSRLGSYQIIPLRQVRIPHVPDVEMRCVGPNSGSVGRRVHAVILSVYIKPRPAVQTRHPVHVQMMIGVSGGLVTRVVRLAKELVFVWVPVRILRVPHSLIVDGIEDCAPLEPHRKLVVEGRVSWAIYQG